LLSLPKQADLDIDRCNPYLSKVKRYATMSTPDNHIKIKKIEIEKSLAEANKKGQMKTFREIEEKLTEECQDV
jgi:hypothetical protein